MSVWTDEFLSVFSDAYVKYGKKWCIDNLGLTDGQVRAKASRLGLKAAGVSEAWKKKQIEHSKILTGRKRPEQAEVILRNHRNGLLKKTDEQRKKIGEKTKKWIKEKGHPKGSLGLVHSEKTRKILSEKVLAYLERQTEEESAQRVMKILKTKFEKGTFVNNTKRGTWKAGWREIGGKRKYFRSKWEANYARYLQWLKEKNQIIEWQHEPKTFWFDGIKRGCVSYLPDFLIICNNGKEEYHEVKGWMDDRSKTKISRMEKYYPDVKLVVIATKEYNSIKKKAAPMISDWEA